MNDREIIRMVEAIQGKREIGGGGTTIMLGAVESVSPLIIKTQKLSISKNIYINPAYTLEAPGGANGIDILFSGAPSPEPLFAFLKDFHKKYIIAPGDTLILIQFATAFYVMEKVVKAA